MDARYLKAAICLPRPIKVCGRQLRPFCLRHRVQLEAIKSPFLDPFKSRFTAKDVVMAVRILSSHEKDAFAKEIGVIEQIRIGWLNMSTKRLARAAGRIVGVISESCSYPKLWHKENTKSHENIPWILSCVANNVRNGCTLEEAWTMPEGEAVWMSISHAIYNGSQIEVLSTEDEKMMDNFDDIINRFKETNKK